MILILIFNDVVETAILSELADSDEFILVKDKTYKIQEPIGFGLGFYNYIVSQNELIGINFQFNDQKIELIDLLKNRNYFNVTVEDADVSVYFNESQEQWIDFSQDFLNFYLLKSHAGDLAITINVSDDFEYKLNVQGRPPIGPR